MKPRQKRSQMLKELESWLATYKELDRHFDALSDVLGKPWDSRLFNVVFTLFDRHTELLEERLAGGDAGWLSWFIYENECGANGYEAKAGTMRRKIKVRNLNDLCKLLEAQAKEVVK